MASRGAALLHLLLPLGSALLFGGVASAQEPTPEPAPTAPATPTTPTAPSTTAPSASSGLTLKDGRFIAGQVVQTVPGRYVVVLSPGGERQAFEWATVALIDGQPRPSVPAGARPSLAPQGWSPNSVEKLGKEGRRASEALSEIVAPESGQKLIGSVKDVQSVLEATGLKRGEPQQGYVGGAMFMLSSCFFIRYSVVVPASFWWDYGCVAMVPMGAVSLALAPFMGKDTPEMLGPSVHHWDASVYALDFEKKSALTGRLQREPSGLGLGYDLGYTYVHPKVGFIGFGHVTLQQTLIDSDDWASVSNNFVKLDSQVGLDVIRLFSGGNSNSGWTKHRAYFRAGPSLFHDWIMLRDRGTDVEERYMANNPLNEAAPLVTAFGYELAAELDFRFPYGLGGVHFTFERGSYPAIDFPGLDPREAALVALVSYDDLRMGDTYTWQRLKLTLEIPINYSRYGGLALGGQLLKYENNFGSGVDNRGLSLDYTWRFE